MRDWPKVQTAERKKIVAARVAAVRYWRIMRAMGLDSIVGRSVLEREVRRRRGWARMSSIVVVVGEEEDEVVAMEE